VVLLVPYLLELVDAARPKRGELYFSPMALDDAVRVRVLAPYDIEPLRGTPTGDELFADGALLAGGACEYPLERTSHPRVIIGTEIIGFHRRRETGENLDVGIRHRPPHQNSLSVVASRPSITDAPPSDMKSMPSVPR